MASQTFSPKALAIVSAVGTRAFERPVLANRPLTFHGLRHTYAAEKYQKLIDSGIGSLDAHFAVSRLLGHERADVTDIYLSSLPKEDHHGK